jgi:hypothetical protein
VAKPPGTRVTSLRTIRTAEEIATRRAAVYDRHLLGHSVRMIADALEIPRSTVQDDIQAVINLRTLEEVAHLRKGASMRIEHYLTEHLRMYMIAARGQPEVKDATGKVVVPAQAANHDRANRLMQTIIQAEERRAKLEDTDAPTRARISVVDDAAIAEAIRIRREQLRLVDPNHPLLDRAAGQPALGTGQ